MRFVDTNILVYSVSLAPEDAVKRRLAHDLLLESDLALSVQVLQEFYTQVTRPPRPTRPWAISHDEAVATIALLQRLTVQETTLELMQNAFALHARFGLNYWDCAILAAAHLLGCDVVYSEDMSDTQDYDGLRVINPFAPSAQPA